MRDQLEEGQMLRCLEDVDGFFTRDRLYEIIDTDNDGASALVEGDTGSHFWACIQGEWQYPFGLESTGEFLPRDTFYVGMPVTDKDGKVWTVTSIDEEEEYLEPGCYSVHTTGPRHIIYDASCSDARGWREGFGPESIETTPEPQFKVGQKLRCLEYDDAGFFTRGRLYEIVDVDYDGPVVEDNEDCRTYACMSGVWTPGFGPESIETQEPEEAGSHDVVDFPAHYSLVGVDEVIDKIRGDLTAEEFRGYCKGNIMKYVLRAAKKNGEEDWRKAAKYFGFMYSEDGSKS